MRLVFAVERLFGADHTHSFLFLAVATVLEGGFGVWFVLFVLACYDILYDLDGEGTYTISSVHVTKQYTWRTIVHDLSLMRLVFYLVRIDVMTSYRP